MGIGPAFAILPVLQTTHISPSDIDFYEINGAFASQAVMSIQHLKIDESKVNMNGGGIALGHPLCATGARQVERGLAVAKQTGGRVFVMIFVSLHWCLVALEASVFRLSGGKAPPPLK
ncbi:acetyl-coenzyme A acyltransferase 1, isoform CRA_b [Coprinopsis sp. MPI-PUGE-AT-0042]|nr:acetyl-coenzyme A acyltransferase 1, isoform CRA_b [Coprinopsis sp. MPI-PUGE-AT-0042]